MAKFELTKTIDARKLHKRTGIPLSEPSVSIPCGAIVENPIQDRDVIKFTYLGEPYQCPEEVFRAASAPIQSVAAPPKPKAEPSAAAERPSLRWEVLSSDAGGRLMRAKVPGGWLVMLDGALTFYPDSEHAWDGSSLP